MAGGASVHYLRANHSCKLSRRHIVFDTESRVNYHDGIQEQTWRLGCAKFMDLDTRRKTPLVTDCDYVNVDSLWSDVSDFTRSGTRTILWAHNLAYDIRISRALEGLPLLGWTLRAIVLDGASCWAKWTREDNTLVMADFTSWAGVSLACIAQWLKLPTEPLPQDVEDTEALFRRCRSDVNVLSMAVLHVLDWIETDDLGNLQITGSGQAFTHFRHRFLTENILVHDDQAARAAERKALWTGRTETWKHGTHQRGSYFEYDLARAYATVARDVGLPTVYVGALSDCKPSDIRSWTPSRCLLSECRVTTRHPIAPTSHNDRIIWPVGDFHTTLWDCEIRAILDAGGDVSIGSTYVYTRTECLRDWATWILASLDPEHGESSPLRRQILKQWSRSLIGRFALQYRSWVPMGKADTHDLYVSNLVGKDEPRGARLFQVGTDLLELKALEETENALPQITGYIAAECRVRLWELMNVAGLDNVYYVDTDSIITNAAGRDQLEQRIADDGAYGLTLKRRAFHLELHGPRALTVDGDRRYSGIPKRAHATGPDTAVGEVWEGLGEALRHGRPDSVLVYERPFRVVGRDQRRAWQADGSTSAYSLPEPAPAS